MRKIILAAVIMGLFLVSFFGAADAKFQPFWDFRHWGGVTKQTPIYRAYMEKFAQFNITALILINKTSLPPFTPERRFLADAARRGVKVWIRTNRVTPKRGIPHRPNSTLDFTLDKTIQKETLNYLLALAALSKEYPNLTGLVIGGEEIIGAKISKEILARYDHVSLRELGFPLSGPLSNAQKIRYFDWLQELQNRWYAEIWDTVKADFPNLNLLIYPSGAAVTGCHLAKFPRPVYWDIYDLIVTRQKHFAVILGLYTIGDPLGSDLTAAGALYVRAATEAQVPYYLLLQAHRTKGSTHTPTREELEADVKAAVESGAAGVGYWPIDMDTKKDVYVTDRNRWQAIFQAIALGAETYPYRPLGRGLMVVKPRYSQFLESFNNDCLRTVSALRHVGLDPEFLLAEEVLTRPLPTRARVFYLPETFKYENTDVIEKLLASGKPLFFGLNQAELSSPDKRSRSPLYELLSLKRTDSPFDPRLMNLREVHASWCGKNFQVAITYPRPHFQTGGDNNLVVATYQDPQVHPNKALPLVWSDGRLIFLASSDCQILLAENKKEPPEGFVASLLAKYLLPKKP
jgi:hypothetical protein